MINETLQFTCDIPNQFRSNESRLIKNTLTQFMAAMPAIK